MGSGVKVLVQGGKEGTVVVDNVNLRVNLLTDNTLKNLTYIQRRRQKIFQGGGGKYEYIHIHII